MTIQPLTSKAVLYHQVAFAQWGNIVRPIVILNPHTDVPGSIREEWQTYHASQDFQICCWIGGDIVYLPRKSIIDFQKGVEEGHAETPLEYRHRKVPLDSAVDRNTQMALEMMRSIMNEAMRLV